MYTTTSSNFSTFEIAYRSNTNTTNTNLLKSIQMYFVLPTPKNEKTLKNIILTINCYRVKSVSIRLCRHIQSLNKCDLNFCLKM